MYIGKKLKELRKSKGLTLVELSKKSGVQVATISRMENMKMTGTIESHMSIAKALDIDVTQLYSEVIKSEKTIDVTRKGSSSDVFIHSDKASHEILTTNVLKKKMMPILLTLEAGGQTNPEQNQLGSEKFLYVLEGKIQVTIGTTDYPLSKGNSIFFEGSLKHHISNMHSKTAKVLSVATPVAL